MEICLRRIVFAAFMSLNAGLASAEARAVVEAVQRTILSSELSGRVIELPKRAGESFSEGEAVARIGCSVYEAERDKVASRLKQAKRSSENKRRLADLDSVGKLEVELAELAVEEKSAELRIARLNTDRCQIQAPFDGTVVKLHVSEYQSVQAQQKLLEIVGRRLQARVIVPAEWLSWLESGQAMNLDIEETGTTVDGQIARIGAAVDPVSHTVPIWVKLHNDGRELRPGMSGTARFPERPGGSAP